MYQKFRDAGLCVIPSDKGHPLTPWVAFQTKLPSVATANNWDEKHSGANYELICGAVSNVIAIDIDTDDPAIIARVEAIAGISPVKKFGTKGFTAFYRFSGEQSTCWKKDGKVILELLAEKRLTCLPPSLHRHTGKPYIWLGSELIGAELPMLGNGFVEVMDVLFPKPKYEPRIVYDTPAESVDLDKASEMLKFISADCARDEWVRVGMALRYEFGDAASPLWHEWSSTSTKYKAIDASNSWRSFNGSGVSIGTLVFMAKQAGWQAPLSVHPVVEQAEPIRKEAQELPKIHGLVGDIADWITSTAIRPQPVLSLAAALAFVGMIRGHRVCGTRNLRTNLLVMSLAPSACGKEHPQYCVSQLAEACGLSKNMMGKPTSGAGLLTGLNKGSGISLLNIDELGRFIGNISMKSSGGFQREITDYIIELFSKAGGIFRGRQYANEKENPQMVITNPHLCVLGSTVKEKLQAACTSSEIIDGFLNRWLVFSVDSRPEESEHAKMGVVPPDLIERVRDEVSCVPELKEIRMEYQAFDRLKQFKVNMIKKVDNEPYPINQLYIRSGEHCEKIALTICNGEIITLQDVENAIMIVEQSNNNVRSFTNLIADTQHEADLLYILDKIKKHKKITKNQLTRTTQKINNKIRNDIITQLVESGQIVQEPTSNGGVSFVAVD